MSPAPTSTAEATAGVGFAVFGGLVGLGGGAAVGVGVSLGGLLVALGVAVAVGVPLKLKLGDPPLVGDGRSAMPVEVVAGELTDGGDGG